MIPKIIHYCWFGRNPLPPLAERCIASWRKYLPDYEICEWNEDNFDVNIIPYTAEAYRQGKYAFVSDYARFWILYKYGGLYFDTDVEVIRPMDDIIERGAFMGFETDPDGENSPLKYPPRYAFGVAVGLGCGFEKGDAFVGEMKEVYEVLEFKKADKNSKIKLGYKNIVAHTTDLLMRNGLQEQKGMQKVMGISIYPSEYFAPINVVSERLHITPNTRTIHRYAGTWIDGGKRSFRSLCKRMLPEWVFFMNNKIKRNWSKIR